MRRNQQRRCALADRRVSIECKLDWRFVREANEIRLGNTVGAHTLTNAVAVIVFCVAVEITTVSILARNRNHFHHDVDKESFLGVRPLIHLDEGTVVKCDVKDLQILPQFTVRLENLPMVVVRQIEEPCCFV